MGDLTRRQLQLGGVLALAAGLSFLPRLLPVRAGLKPAAERRPMPNFTYTDLNDRPWSMEAQRGKIVFVNFWATWCGPCRQETPDLVELHARYGDRVSFAGVAMDDEPDAVVPGFVAQYRVTYPVLIPPPDSPLTSAIQNLPTSFLIDRDGKIARTYIGLVNGRQLTADIDALLGAT